ncbi:MAG: sigma-54 dependent transcriptional regulator [Muribaculaceae bacterium]|nr:sigma-54 dependent transcriptional regulator [Muribaculaceae bacterium]
MPTDIATSGAEVPREVERVKQRFSIVGNSPALTDAILRAIKVAPIDLSVLIIGESGTGKEFFPQIIHNSGSRKHKKYIAVNCGAIPEGTIDSELFGHEKGAFTGAVATRKGYFEEADGGTIFLDEVAELPLTTQARLLRVLESGEFMKVGSSVVQRTNVRIVAATNVDLMGAVRKGKFREDLYYRLSTVLINVPPLHERGEDVVTLARRFAAGFSEKYMTRPITFSDDARRAMMLYRWPGNVRQLKNIVEQLALFNAGSEVSRTDLIELLPTPDRSKGDSIPMADIHTYEQDRELLWQTLFAMKSEIAELRAALGGAAPRRGESACALLPNLPPRGEPTIFPAAPAATRGGILSEVLNDTASDATPLSLEDTEREAIAEALRRNNGDKRRAAEQLGISPRTLYRKIHDFGLSES